MATIDDLVARVPDAGLRAALAEQVRRLVERKDFGLVFQDHLPEGIEVPQLRAVLGSAVRHRKLDSSIYRVANVNGEAARSGTKACEVRDRLLGYGSAIRQPPQRSIPGSLIHRRRRAPVVGNVKPSR
jgi:hypothetical protein